MIRIAIGADHRGFDIKKQLINEKTLAHVPVVWDDVGAYSAERSDYPIFAQLVSECIVHKGVDYGVLLCGTGVGMAMAANRYPKVYAGVAWNEDVARRSREEDGVNILCLPTDYLNYQQVHQSIVAWLSATFKEGRYQERLLLIDAAD